MKQKLIFIFFLTFSVSVVFSQTKIIGHVQNDKGEAINKAIVQLLGTTISAETDNSGNFVLDNVSQGHYQIYIFAEGYTDYFNEIVIDKAVIDLGNITLSSLAKEEDLTIVETGQDDIAQEEAGEENLSGLLHGSRDVFLSAAAYNLGILRFKVRGYDYEYNEVNINGVPMENLDNGRVYWSLWGGLNNVTRFKTSYLGLQRNDMTFGGLAGSTNIEIFPSKYGKGTNITYSLTNRSYRQRLMFIHSTGIMQNGWALTISGSRRWSQEGYIPGTFYDAWAYYIGAEKQFKKHNLAFNIFGAPIRRGKAGPTVQEVYDLTGNHFYNPYWGWQNGKKRNSRIAHSHIPVLIITDVWHIDNNTKLTTTLSGRFGSNGATALNWYNAPDPRPDYYRYLPSYMTNPQVAELVAEAFRTDDNYRQINWTAIYDANRSSYETINNANGIEGNVISGYRAQYIIEDRRYDQESLAFSSVLNKTVNDKLTIDGGFLARYFVTHNFKKVVDLLGADYYVDVDKFAERDYADPIIAQNNLFIPNHVVYTGDKFGYDYNAVIYNTRVWTQAFYSLPKIDLFASGYVSYTNFWRVGFMKNGRFPDNSYGKSKGNSFVNFGVKSGITYKITGRHFIVSHLGYFTKAPNFMNSYVSPRTRDQIADNLVSEKAMHGDIGYYLRAPRIKATITAFYTDIKDRTKIRSFYHDGYRNFVNYVLTGIDEVHQGIEMAFQANVSSALTFSGAGSLGYYYYNSRPNVTITVDNSSEVLAEDRQVYMKGYFVSGTPQTALTSGLRYNGPNYWFAGFNVNYVDNNYISINPERRTPEAVEYVIPESEQWYAILNQEKLNSGFTIDAYFYKSFKFENTFVYLNISVNNILNNTNIKTGGFEQLRFDMTTHDPDRFPPKYFYYYGRQYFINIRVRF